MQTFTRWPATGNIEAMRTICAIVLFAGLPMPMTGWAAVAQAVPICGAPLRGAPAVMPIGYVKDASQASNLARRVAIEIYGAKTIKGEEPLEARLEGNTWVVEGHLHRGYFGGVVFGGIVRVSIDRSTGAVRGVCHGE